MFLAWRRKKKRKKKTTPKVQCFRSWCSDLMQTSWFSAAGSLYSACVHPNSLWSSGWTQRCTWGYLESLEQGHKWAQTARWTPWWHCLHCSGLNCLRWQFQHPLAPHLFGSCKSPWLCLRCPSLHPRWWRSENTVICNHQYFVCLKNNFRECKPQQRTVLIFLCASIYFEIQSLL